MPSTDWTRRRLLGGLAGLASAAAAVATSGELDVAKRRSAYRRWLESLPSVPEPALTKHGLVAAEIAHWSVLEANQAAAVDVGHFYGIGNHAIVKHRKDSGERVAQWFGPRGGPIVHFNAGYVEGDHLVLAHSNHPQLPMASSIETFDARTLQPVATHSLGIRLGSLTWAVRHRGWWWACFSNYNDSGTTPGFDQRWTHVGQFDDAWQLRQSWLFPPQVVATWGDSACSGGDWGDDGLLYVTGHDAPELYVLRLPRQGVTLEYVTTIDVPFEGQGWAWDRSTRGQRVIYGIRRVHHQIVAARIPALPDSLRSLTGRGQSGRRPSRRS
jgi:hypothetical protein